MYLWRPAQVKSMCGKHCTQCETAETVFDLSHKQPTVITWSEFWTYVRTTWNNKKKTHEKFIQTVRGRKKGTLTYFFLYLSTFWHVDLSQVFSFLFHRWCSHPHLYLREQWEGDSSRCAVTHILIWRFIAPCLLLLPVCDIGSTQGPFLLSVAWQQCLRI